MEGITDGVIEGADGVLLGAAVVMAVGTGVTVSQAPAKDKMSITENTIDIRCRSIINESIWSYMSRNNCRISYSQIILVWTIACSFSQTI
jgi:hypothetical protein